MGSLFGGLFSGIGSLVSGILGSQAQNAANAQNAMNANIQNINAKAQFAQEQEDWSVNFQNTLDQQALAQQQQGFNNWVTQGGNIGSVMANLVDSAKAEGLNPLSVLGMNTPGASVVPGVGASGNVGATAGFTSPDIRPSTGLASSIGTMGQDVGRAIENYYDANSRKAALAEEYTRAQITNLDAQSASLTMDAARKLGAPGTPKPNSDLNHFIFGKEPQWPVGIPGDLATGLLKGIDWGAGKLDNLGQWFEHLRINEPDPSVYNTP